MSELFEINFNLEHIDIQCDENQKGYVMIRHFFTSTSPVNTHGKLSAFFFRSIVLDTFIFTDNVVKNHSINQIVNERL
jgi:hypothetical protein